MTMDYINDLTASLSVFAMRTLTGSRLFASYKIKTKRRFKVQDYQYCAVSLLYHLTASW